MIEKWGLGFKPNLSLYKTFARHYTLLTQPVGRKEEQAYLTLVKTMSTSVRVMDFPSMTLQSLHSLDQFLPCRSFPVARVSPWMAKRRNDSSSAVSSTGVADPAPPSLVPLDSEESLFMDRSLECSLGGRRGDCWGCFAIWTLNSAISLGIKRPTKRDVTYW